MEPPPCAAELDAPIAVVSEIGEGPSRFPDALPVLPILGPGEVRAGRPDRAAAPLITRSIERAVAARSMPLRRALR